MPDHPTPSPPHRAPRPAAAVRIALAGLAIALAAAGAGCAKKKEAAPATDHAVFRTIAEIHSRADAIFAARDTMKAIRGRWSAPGVTSNYIARRADDRIRFLEEAEDRGQLGVSDNRYYYDDAGVFFFYEDRGDEREPRGSLPPMSRLIQRSAIFDSTGALVWGRRLVDGVANALPDSQAALIRERALTLQAHASGMVP